MSEPPFKIKALEGWPKNLLQVALPITQKLNSMSKRRVDDLVEVLLGASLLVSYSFTSALEMSKSLGIT